MVLPLGDAVESSKIHIFFFCFNYRHRNDWNLLLDYVWVCTGWGGGGVKLYPVHPGFLDLCRCFFALNDNAACWKD